MAVKWFFKRSLTGGGAALDGINTTGLADDARATVETSTVVYFYRFDASSSDAESTPDVIAPDTGTGRWHLIGLIAGGILHIDTVNNRVGINTLSPNVDLQIGNGGVSDRNIRMNSSVSGEYIQLYSTGTWAALYKKGTGGALVVGTIDAETLQLVTNSITRIKILPTGEVGIGNITPTEQLDVDGAIAFREKSSDPSDPAEGRSVLWMSDGTGSGDDGDIMMKITAGGSTKTVTLVDFSAA